MARNEMYRFECRSDNPAGLTFLGGSYAGFNSDDIIDLIKPHLSSISGVWRVTIWKGKRKLRRRTVTVLSGRTFSVE